MGFIGQQGRHKCSILCANTRVLLLLAGLLQRGGPAQLHFDQHLRINRHAKNPLSTSGQQQPAAAAWNGGASCLMPAGISSDAFFRDLLLMPIRSPLKK